MPQSILDAAYLTPHGFCLAWQPSLLLLHVVSDGAIASSYYSIPLALGYFVLRRRDLAFGWVFMLFACFILACGTTHLMDIWTLWHADYLAQGVVKAVTAVLSVLTATALWPLIPQALALPSPQLLQAEAARKEAALDALRRETAERERTEDMLRQSQKMEAIGQLTGGVAHDFNNLLMVIQGNLEILRDRMGEEAACGAYVERALGGVRRANTLTHQLLSFARRQPLQPSTFDPNSRIREVSEMLARMLGEDVRLRLDLAADLWPAEADQNQLENALLNLAINARDAMPDGGALTLRSANATLSAAELGSDAEAEPGDYVAVSIEDDGCGMTEEVRRSAFEPFFTTKPVGSGSGLGLSQIYGFVRQSRGHVTLDSEPGRGTTVTLFLRRAAAAAEEGAALQASAA
jgi:signal transduction histidine kinase